MSLFGARLHSRARDTGKTYTCLLTVVLVVKDRRAVAMNVDQPDAKGFSTASNSLLNRPNAEAGPSSRPDVPPVFRPPPGIIVLFLCNYFVLADLCPIVRCEMFVQFLHPLDYHRSTPPKTLFLVSNSCRLMTSMCDHPYTTQRPANRYQIRLL